MLRTVMGGRGLEEELLKGYKHHQLVFNVVQTNICVATRHNLDLVALEP